MAIEQPSRIVAQQFGVHAFDVGSSIFKVGTDNTVPITHVYQLYPCHVYLSDSRTAPLSSFEHDDANGVVGGTLLFEQFQVSALRTIENEGYVVGTHFIFDADKHSRPKLKVVSDAFFEPK